MRRFWVDVVFKLGIGSAIALYLVWQLSSTLPAMARTLDTHVADTRQQIKLLHALCLIAAHSETERRWCEVSE